MDKRSHNATLNSKGLEDAVSEEQARRMCASRGQSSLFIVEAHHGKLVIDEDGSERIHLVIDQIELIPSEHEERVRRFKRALYLARPDQYGQAALEGSTAGEPTVSDTASQLDAVVEEDTETGDPVGVWDPNSETGGGECAYPGCVLDIGHDGDHAEASDEDAPDNVVSFSG